MKTILALALIICFMSSAFSAITLHTLIDIRNDCRHMMEAKFWEYSPKQLSEMNI